VRDAGVVFVKSDQPVRLAAASDAVRVDYRDPLLAADVAEEFDAAVMADRQPRGTGAPAPVAELRSGPDGEAQYDNIWLLPSLTNRPGILVAGAARGNREYREALTDGMAAARQAHELLADGRLEVRDDAATVDSETCVFCLTCKRICPHGAIRVDLEARAACVSTVACRRCGACAAECPVKAITLPRYTDEETAADVGPAPKIVVFACENSAIPAAAAAVAQQAYPVEVELVRVPCAGQVDPRNVLAALESGARKVLVLGCHPESCQYLTGSTRATRRLERIGRMLEKAGFDRSRLAFGGIAAVEPKRFIEYVSAT
jgi:coenzyme F420-reducing hydrogenase delta subunit/Pyruvate/2-oxoacid:ferredoxin oxidoreductase delta subunit